MEQNNIIQQQERLIEQPIITKELFQELFIHADGKTTSFQNSDGSYMILHGNGFTNEDVISHLAGYKTIGLPVLHNGACKFAVADIDIKKEYYSKPDFRYEDYKPQIEQQREICSQHAAAFGIEKNLYWEYSGFKGAHGWFFFDSCIPVVKVYQLLRLLFDDFIVPRVSEAIHIDFYPKGERPAEWLIRGPWGVNRKSGMRSSWIKPFPSQKSDIKVVTAGQVDEILDPINSLQLNCKAIRDLRLKVLKEKHLTHQERFALADLYKEFENDGTRYLVDNFIRLCTDYDPEYTDEQLNHISKKKYKPVSCQQQLQKNSICVKTCPHIGKDKSPIVFAKRAVGDYKSIELINTFDEKYSESWIVDRFLLDYPNIVYAIREDYFYEYSNGVYQQVGDLEVGSRINTFMLKFLEPKEVTNTRIDNVTKRLKKMEPIQFKGEWNPEMFKINLKNGVLDVKTKTLLPHDPSYKFTRQLRFEYDPNAQSARFISFLREILEPMDELLIKTNDEKQRHWQDKIYFILDWMCYSLFNDYSYQKILNLIGLKGRNGKGRLAHVWENLLGSENISHVDLQKLAKGEFGLINLRGKFLNITTDLRITDSLDVTELKRLSGGDIVSANVKKKPFVEFLNTARLVALSNEIPRLGEVKLATLERFQFVEFEKTFTGDEVDRQLDEKLTAELPGIFNLLLERFDHIYSETTGFNINEPEFVGLTMDKFKADLHNVLEFVQECLEPDSQCCVDRVELYRYYCTMWAAYRGYSNSRVSNVKFWNIIKGAGYQCFRSKVYDNKNMLFGMKPRQDYVKVFKTYAWTGADLQINNDISSS